MTKDDCIFCKIVAGDIPSTKVYEDDRVLAFRDLNPMMPVHVLIVPKNHYDNIADGVSPEDMVAVMDAVGTVAEAEGIKESGFRIVANTTDDACQTVHHLHVHVLGGGKMNDGDPSLD